MSKKTFSHAETSDQSSDAGKAMGTGAANTGATQYMVNDVDRFNTPRGHGFAAEKMNDYYDKARGRDAKVVGGDNAKNGADRIVDGIEIQTKYCKSGSKCVGECFENGKFRYINSEGKPMQVEVPSDKYDDAVRAMEERIKRGEVQGVSDPNEAKNIIRKGNFTYEQARNVARFGTVESITFDAVQGTVIAAYSFGISTAMNFAVAVWNGKPFDEAVKNSAAAGLKVGGTAFVTTVLASQMQRTALNSLLRGSTDQIVRIMGPKASALLANAFRSGAKISGAAAMQSASKLLRGNVITGAITVVVLSSFDVANLFRGRISGKQLFKNIGKTTATVAGGTGGWMAGAAAGAEIGTIIPGIGNAAGAIIGGLIGSFAGGSAAGAASSAVLDEMIEDDAVKMQEILEKQFQQLGEDYLVTQSEGEKIVDRLKNIVDGDFLMDMYASSSHSGFARQKLEPLFEDIAKSRKKIQLPSNEQMVQGLKAILNEIADDEEYADDTESQSNSKFIENIDNIGTGITSYLGKIVDDIAYAVDTKPQSNSTSSDKYEKGRNNMATPKCPQCESNQYVVLEKTFKKVGTAAGAVAGASIGASIGTALLPGFGTVVGGALGGMIANREKTDKMMGTYRCEKCGKIFEADS